MRKFRSIEESERWPLVNAETDEELLARYTEAMQVIKRRCGHGGRIVAVSHGGAMRAFLQNLFGPEVFPDSQRAENASITRFIWGDDGVAPRLLEIGKTGHLEPRE
jgi:broad specificity phosphatase PhoE